MSLKESIDVVLNKDAGYYDISIDENGDFKTDDALDAAIIVSITAQRRATRNEVPNPLLRRGWIGNESTEGFEIGSKIWLYHQARKTRTNLNGIQTTVENCLSWMLDLNIVDSLEVSVEYFGATAARALISVERSGNKISKYYPLWENTGN